MESIVLAPAKQNRAVPRDMSCLLPVHVNLVHILVLLLTLLAGCILWVWSKASVLRERYLLEEVQREQARIQMEHRTLRLTWATFTSPKALEEAARKRFHLRHPKPQEVVRLP